MRRVDDALPVGHIVNLVDEDRALFRQLVHNITVVNDFATDVDGRAEGIEGNLYDVDRAHHSGAETAWLKQQNTLGGGGSSGAGTVRNGIEDSGGHINSIPT